MTAPKDTTPSLSGSNVPKMYLAYCEQSAIDEMSDRKQSCFNYIIASLNLKNPTSGRRYIRKYSTTYAYSCRDFK